MIVNTASVAAFDGQIGQAAYSASKGGVVGMTLPIARDLAVSRIRVRHDRAGPLRHADAGEPPRAGASVALGATVPFPARLGRPEEYARARGPHRREPDAERRDDPPRRRAAHGAEVTAS